MMIERWRSDTTHHGRYGATRARLGREALHRGRGGGVVVTTTRFGGVTTLIGAGPMVLHIVGRRVGWRKRRIELYHCERFLMKLG